MRSSPVRWKARAISALADRRVARPDEVGDLLLGGEGSLSLSKSWSNRRVFLGRPGSWGRDGGGCLPGAEAVPGRDQSAGLPVDAAFPAAGFLAVPFFFAAAVGVAVFPALFADGFFLRRPAAVGRLSFGAGGLRSRGLAAAGAPCPSLAALASISSTARSMPIVSTSSPFGSVTLSFAVLDVGAVAAAVNRDRLTIALAQFAQGRRRSAAAAARPGLRHQLDRPVRADGQDIVVLRQVDVLAVVEEVRPVAPYAGLDFLALRTP